ncbi:MAG TPA: type II secretion system F family protein [Gallionella sp.]|nr:type II secretion system F family protein [Gallionella sp.]
MNAAIVVALIAAVLMAGGAVLLWMGAPKQDRRSRVSERLEAWASLHPHEAERRLAGRTGLARIAWLAPLLQRSGLSLTPKLQAILAVIPLVGVPFLAIFLGTWVVVGFLLLYPLALYGALRWKIRQFSRALVAQLPGYLDGVARSLAVGNSMPIALRLSMEQSIEPIPQVFRQVVQRQELGVSIENALEQVAAIYHVRELTLLASAITVNSRYGGKLEAVLSNIANSIREYDRAQRELIAMTAETRLSALILSALPILIALMMSTANPGYIRGMWLDASGRWLLIGAFSLDLIGTVILLRMARV